MRRHLPIGLPPTGVDLETSRLIRRHATPTVERAGKAITFAADEKLILAGAFVYWLYRHGRRAAPRETEQADHFLVCATISSVLPHLLKRLVDRKRPDRKLMHGLPRHGIPHSGNPKDSFPSGHAMHLGTLAAALTRTEPAPVAAIGWVAALALASTRLLLLAHYLTDVLTGLALGTAIEWLIAGIAARRRLRAETS
jgi:membrane-associated phospholipid phosphatase